MNVSKKLFSGILCGTLLLASAPAQCGKKLGLALFAGGVGGAYTVNKILQRVKADRLKHQEHLNRYLGIGYEGYAAGIDVPVDLDGYNRIEKKLKSAKRRSDKVETFRKDRNGAKQKTLKEEKANVEKLQKELDDQEFIKINVKKNKRGRYGYSSEDQACTDKHKAEAKSKVIKTKKGLREANKKVWFTKAGITAGLGLVVLGLWQFFKK